MDRRPNTMRMRVAHQLEKLHVVKSHFHIQLLYQNGIDVAFHIFHASPLVEIVHTFSRPLRLDAACICVEN